MPTRLWILLGLIPLNIPVYRWAWNWAFGDYREFVECLEYWFMPDVVSLLRGEYRRDFLGESKLFLFLIVCVGAVAIEFFAIAMIWDLIGSA